MSLHGKAMLAQFLALMAEGPLEFREPIIGAPKPAPYNDKYDIEIQDKAEAKRLRKKKRKGEERRG